MSGVMTVFARTTASLIVSVSRWTGISRMGASAFCSASVGLAR
jgi:hypothetical protein